MMEQGKIKMLGLISIFLSLLVIKLRCVSISLFAKSAKLHSNFYFEQDHAISKKIIDGFLANAAEVSQLTFILALFPLIISLIIYRKKLYSWYINLFVAIFAIISAFFTFYS